MTFEVGMLVNLISSIKAWRGTGTLKSRNDHTDRWLVESIIVGAFQDDSGYFHECEMEAFGPEGTEP